MHLLPTNGLSNMKLSENFANNTFFLISYTQKENIKNIGKKAPFLPFFSPLNLEALS